MASRLTGMRYRVAFTMYSRNGEREVEVREFSNGETYLAEREMLDGTNFIERHSGNMVGPFPSPEDAEKFIIQTAWFRGEE